MYKVLTYSAFAGTNMHGNHVSIVSMNVFLRKMCPLTNIGQKGPHDGDDCSKIVRTFNCLTRALLLIMTCHCQI